MRSVVLLGVMMLVLAFVLAVFVGSSDESLPTMDLRHPGTLWRMAARGLRNMESRVRESVGAASAGFRERLRHEDAN